MKSLIIDTSTANMYLCLASDGKEKKSFLLTGQNDHTKKIMLTIAELLKEDPLDSIDEIIVGIGPGSYTGVRIGVTVAKMLAWTKKIALKKISSLFLLSSGYDGQRAMMIDARRGNVFGAVYDDDRVVINECHIAKEQFMEIAKGQGTLAFYMDNEPRINVGVIVANAVAVENVHALVPNYLRETEAERAQHEN